MDSTRGAQGTAGADVPRRVLLAIGGMVLLGGCAAAQSSRPKSASGHAHDVAPGSPNPADVDPATAHRQTPGGRHRERQRHARTVAADEPPMRYIQDGRKAIALTIDDGPSPVYTPQILRLLRKYGITASFSMIGINVLAHPDVAREVADAGHVIVNHTQTHHNLVFMPPAKVTDEMSYANEAIHRATGKVPGMFRAPYGVWSPVVLQRCQAMGMTPLDWSVDPRDWSRPGIKAIIRTIMANTRTGSIILEHDGGGDRSETVAALRVVIPRLLHAGYHFTTP